MAKFPETFHHEGQTKHEPSKSGLGSERISWLPAQLSLSIQVSYYTALAISFFFEEDSFIYMGFTSINRGLTCILQLEAHPTSSPTGVYLTIIIQRVNWQLFRS